MILWKFFLGLHEVSWDKGCDIMIKTCWCLYPDHKCCCIVQFTMLWIPFVKPFPLGFNIIKHVQNGGASPNGVNKGNFLFLEMFLWKNGGNVILWFLWLVCIYNMMCTLFLNMSVLFHFPIKQSVSGSTFGSNQRFSYWNWTDPVFFFIFFFHHDSSLQPTVRSWDMK